MIRGSIYVLICCPDLYWMGNSLMKGGVSRYMVNSINSESENTYGGGKLTNERWRCYPADSFLGWPPPQRSHPSHLAIPASKSAIQPIQPAIQARAVPASPRASKLRTSLLNQPTSPIKFFLHRQFARRYRRVSIEIKVRQLARSIRKKIDTHSINPISGSPSGSWLLFREAKSLVLRSILIGWCLATRYSQRALGFDQLRRVIS